MIIKKYKNSISSLVIFSLILIALQIVPFIHTAAAKTIKKTATLIGPENDIYPGVEGIKIKIHNEEKDYNIYFFSHFVPNKDLLITFLPHKTAGDMNNVVGKAYVEFDIGKNPLNIPPTIEEYNKLTKLGKINYHLYDGTSIGMAVLQTEECVFGLFECNAKRNSCKTLPWSVPKDKFVAFNVSGPGKTYIIEKCNQKVLDVPENKSKQK